MKVIFTKKCPTAQRSSKIKANWISGSLDRSLLDFVVCELEISLSTPSQLPVSMTPQIPMVALVKDVAGNRNFDALMIAPVPALVMVKGKGAF